MIRPIEAKDLPKLQELAGWEFGPDFMAGLVLVDSQDAPVLYAGAWRLAEVHIAMDHQWSTPAARFLALKEIHVAMEKELKALHVKQAVTWFDKAWAFSRRLERHLGWVMSNRISWHRKVT